TLPVRPVWPAAPAIATPAPLRATAGADPIPGDADAERLADAPDDIPPEAPASAALVALAAPDAVGAARRACRSSASHQPAHAANAVTTTMPNASHARRCGRAAAVGRTS